jgi:hypothetical protein
MPDCLNCGESLEPSEFPFGDYVECPHCRTTHETDWDYVSEDSLAWWVTGILPDDTENE